MNNCLFLKNRAVTTATNSGAFGGAIDSFAQAQNTANLKVFDSVFKKNEAIQVDTVGGGGAISVSAAGQNGVLILGSVFELNEASDTGGAALIADVSRRSVKWINNKEFLFGNDAGNCDGESVEGEGCFNVGDNFF